MLRPALQSPRSKPRKNKSWFGNHFSAKKGAKREKSEWREVKEEHMHELLADAKSADGLDGELSMAKPLRTMD